MTQRDMIILKGSVDASAPAQLISGVPILEVGGRGWRKIDP